MSLLPRLTVLAATTAAAMMALMPGRAATGASSQGQSRAPIRQEMGGLFVAISDFLPLVLNKAEFESPKNAREVASLMNRLQDLSGKMTASTKRFADNDPSIPFIAEKFNEDVRMAIEMWNNGDRVIPRRLMRNVTDYCISCHTRTSKGLHLSDVIQSQRFKSMPSLAKAEYLAATRQFEDALKHYEHVLVDKPLAKTDPESWSLAVRKMMAISVRVQENASLTTDLLSKIQDTPESIPPSMRGEIAAWRQSAKSWMSERRPASMSDQERFELAKRLVSEGQALSAKVEGGALIEYMRASAIMHNLMGRVKDGPQIQEMMWVAGQASENIRDLNMWTMQDIYYEGCIRKGKDKTLAGRCLEAMEKSLLRTYGAASKAGLPPFTKNQLDELTKLLK
jgi:hypothetical protein